MNFTIQLRNKPTRAVRTHLAAAQSALKAVSMIRGILWPSDDANRRGHYDAVNSIIDILDVCGFKPNSPFERSVQSGNAPFRYKMPPGAPVGSVLTHTDENGVERVVSQLAQPDIADAPETSALASQEWADLQRQWLGQDGQVVARTKPSQPGMTAQEYNRCIHAAMQDLQDQDPAVLTPPSQNKRTTTKEKTSKLLPEVPTLKIPLPTLKMPPVPIPEWLMNPLPGESPIGALPQAEGVEEEPRTGVPEGDEEQE